MLTLLEQIKVTLFKIEPTGQEVQIDRLLGKQVKHCEDWVQVKHVVWFKNALL